MDEQRRKFIVEDEHYHRITVRRRHVFEDALVALRRGFPFDRYLAVTFLGEPAVDAGGPCREFFRLLTQEVFMKKSFFVETRGHVFQHTMSQRLRREPSYMVWLNMHICREAALNILNNFMQDR